MPSSRRHPAPPLLRDGVVEPIELESDLLFGVRPHRYRVRRLDLRPGDRLVQWSVCLGASVLRRRAWVFPRR